jgi:hypothetical protein
MVLCIDAARLKQLLAQEPIVAQNIVDSKKTRSKKKRKEDNASEAQITAVRFGLHELYRVVEEKVKEYKVASDYERVIAPSGFSENTSGSRPQDLKRWEEVDKCRGVQCPKPDCRHGFVGKLQSKEQIAALNRKKWLLIKRG